MTAGEAVHPPETPPGPARLPDAGPSRTAGTDAPVGAPPHPVTSAFRGPARTVPAPPGPALLNGIPTAKANPPGAISLFVSTGSTSADRLAAPVVAGLRRRIPVSEASGIGGQPLAEQGVRTFADPTPHAAIGLFGGIAAVAGAADMALRAFRQVDRHLRRGRPDLLLLVDNPFPNLHLLAAADRLRLRCAYFAAPEQWGLWRWDVAQIVSQADVLIPLLPREAEFWQSRGARVRWCGHPLVDLLGDLRLRRSAGAGLRPVADPRAPVIGLMPGSRRAELQELLPVMKGAAELLVRDLPGARFVTVAANAGAAGRLASALRTWTVPVEVLDRPSVEVMAGCDVMLSCSGTATLEAAVLGVPVVVLYKLRHLADRFLRWALFPSGALMALPNYIVGRAIVPELQQTAAEPARAAAEVLALLRDETRRRSMEAGLAELRERLGPPGAIGRVVEVLAELASHPKRRG